MRRRFDRAILAFGFAFIPGSALARVAQDASFYEVPDLEELAEGAMREVIERYSTDLRALERFWDVSVSPTRRAQQRRLWSAWRAGLAELDFDALDQDGRIDWILFDNRLRYELGALERDEAQWEEMAELLPFAATIVELQETRRRLEPIDPRALAVRLHQLAEVIGDTEEAVRAGLKDVPDGAQDGRNDAQGADPDEPVPQRVEKLVANRAAGQVRDLERTLSSWYRYYDGYDPLFTWWCAEPYGRVEEALKGYRKFLRETVAGVDEDDTDTILGDPIGREALLAELAREMIPYTPEELVEIANAELAWCDREMLKAAHELGFGDDWRAALEHVKDLHVEPGAQPALIRMLAQEAVDFLEQHELLTIPAFAKNVWRMEMMTPERQKLTPYFTGGEVISVSFPTSGMSHEDKLMSMRGNNIHFSRATVHHELIPGHHLQGFMTARHKAYRRLFSTPFWGEGWALYWEMLLWDLGFPQSAEDRVGMLFWRRHRCARIIFSLGFHLGDMTPGECIDFLVERVGHERRNATAEVRRSVQGGYGPLYQAAYMVGGLQFLALHGDLVRTERMTDREFHDAILRQGSIPVELVRAKLTNRPLTREFQSTWRFHDGR